MVNRGDLINHDIDRIGSAPLAMANATHAGTCRQLNGTRLAWFPVQFGAGWWLVSPTIGWEYTVNING